LEETGEPRQEGRTLVGEKHLDGLHDQRSGVGGARIAALGIRHKPLAHDFCSPSSLVTTLRRSDIPAEREPKVHGCLRALGVGLLTLGLSAWPLPSASAQTPTFSGQWELLIVVAAGPTSETAYTMRAQVVDIVRLSLGTPQLGVLNGTWDESAVPSWAPGLALNQGSTSGSYAVIGRQDGSGYDLQVQNADLGLSSFTANLGNMPLLSQQPHGCTPLTFTPQDAARGADLYLSDLLGDNYILFHPSWFPGIALGSKLSCQAWPPSAKASPQPAPPHVSPSTAPQPLVLSLKPHPSRLGRHGGTVTITGTLKNATRCRLELLSHQSFPVVYANNTRPCTSDFSATVTIGADPTHVDRTVAFALIARNGLKSFVARVYIGLAGQREKELPISTQYPTGGTVR
jgi:hypothetical protein